MDQIQLRSTCNVEYVQSVGSDESICKTARVSTLGSASIDSEESAGLINFLMKNRHGSPFEHASMTFRISAPIFVWREFMRHRIGVSYNEQSGRYMELEPVFYVPAYGRPLIQTGKPGEYKFVDGSEQQAEVTMSSLIAAYNVAWYEYQNLLHNGIAKEVARMCLPVSIYSTAYVTMNPRSLMHFLSLRREDPSSLFPSHPMFEINALAGLIEELFSKLFPITHRSYIRNGMVAP